MEKSEARWISNDPRPLCMSNLGWQWKDPATAGDLLGFSFQTGLTDEVILESMLVRLHKQLKL